MCKLVKKIQKIQNPKQTTAELLLSSLFSLLETRPLHHQRERLCVVLFSRGASVVAVFDTVVSFVRCCSFIRRRESVRYIHGGGDAKNVAKDDDERTISKSKVGTVLRAL